MTEPLPKRDLLMLLMPAYSTVMQRGVVRRWYKNEGDAVQRGDIIAAVETDGATFDIEAADDCEITHIRAAPGAAAIVGEMIAIMKMRTPLSVYSARAFLRWQYSSEPNATFTPNYFYFSRPYFGLAVKTDSRSGHVDPYSLACFTAQDIGERRQTLLNAAPHLIEDGLFGWPELQMPGDLWADYFGKGKPTLGS